jgi:hypothetical protein
LLAKKNLRLIEYRYYFLVVSVIMCVESFFMVVSIAAGAIFEVSVVDIVEVESFIVPVVEEPLLQAAKNVQTERAISE